MQDAKHDKNTYAPKKSPADSHSKWAASELLREHREEALPFVPNASRVDDDGIRWMRRDIIKTLRAAFQPRSFNGQMGDAQGTIKDITEAINRAGIERIDPIKVWWSGKMWFVVDGHHRLAAVDRVNLDRKTKGRDDKIREVPVEIVQGGILMANLATTKDNGKTHLHLSAKDRCQWAWRTAVLHWTRVYPERFVMAKAAPDLHVHERTLKSMKATFRQILQRFRDENDGRFPDPNDDKDASWIFTVVDLKWPQQAVEWAKGTANQTTVRDDAWREQEVQKTAEKLVRVLGKEAFSSPGRAEITAGALLAVSSRFIELAKGDPDFSEAVVRAFKDDFSYLARGNLGEMDAEF